ncbi:Holliday junction branch migration protein RuvA [Streptococcus pacificus]|uniref:Holliday junction branch migration complex subunit RuvA n=1 Tax=Streptococcus pacificus TaxID=2740577 RepID=A0ABS0ZK01_9STRE|nr:Holliday junction branch migration protein RuvA [Streptococcus pacificus]MBJ8326292.1 Holliday junction branch migration protein RuvA [Streptococcus pacificus]
MYDYIKGTLSKITAKYIVVEVSGIGYIIHVANPYSFSNQVNQAIKIYLYQVVREDAQLLYGFHNEEEKTIFLNLISVTGIGPTSALAIIAADDNDGLVAAIDNKDITYLMKFPKIGKKTAQQMILDLAGKFAETTTTNKGKTNTKETSSTNHALEEAMEALSALGYKASELKKIHTFFEGTTETTQDYIKAALKMLIK